MKKIFYLLLVIVTFVGCNEHPRNGLTVGNLLDFSTYLTSTKGIAKTEFVMGDQFFVMGVNTKTGDYKPENPNGDEFIFDMEAAKGVPVMNFGKDKDNNDVWKYNNPIVWSDGKSTFFAFSPIPNHTNNFGIKNYDKGFKLNEIPSINFTVAGGYDPITASADEIAEARAMNGKQIDLITAYVPNQTAGKPVALTFQHALAQINFAIKPAHNVGFVRINSIAIHNVATSAKLELASTQDPTQRDYTGGWVQESLAEHKAFAVNLRHDIASLVPPILPDMPDKIYQLNDVNQTLMMIPQALINITVKVNYSYSADGVNWPQYQTGKELSIPLSTVSSHWKPAQQYRYVISISPDSGAGFDPSITEFE